MSIRFKHVAIPASIVAGVGAALITSAVAQSGGSRTTLAAPPFTSPSVVVALAAGPMTGADEAGTTPVTPPGDAVAVGQSLVTVNTATNEVCGNLSATDLAPFNGFHIHKGDENTRNGPIVVDWAPPKGSIAPFSKCVIASSPALAQDIAAHPENYYVNVHTDAFPAGAISAQLGFRTSFSQETQETQLLGAPVRVYDTRFNSEGKFTPGTTRMIDLATSGIPVAARAAIVTVTVTRADAAGFLTVYSNALTVAPNTSNVNFTADEDIANNITVATDGNNKIKITSGAAGTTPGAVGSNEDVVVDVVGYLI
jgi:CHRD domain